MYMEKDFEAVKSIILQDVPEVAQIILFGSYARGDAREDSDMDFMIITKYSLERKEKLKVLTNTRWHSARAGYKTDFLLKSEADFLKAQQEPTISKLIAREGKILWRKN